MRSSAADGKKRLARRLLTAALLLSVAAETDARKRYGKGRGLGGADVNKDWIVPANWCTVEQTSNCCGDGVCNAPHENEATCMADCPGVTTHPTCGEEPHSDRGGKGRTFGVSHRAKSAQEYVCTWPNRRPLCGIACLRNA